MLSLACVIYAIILYYGDPLICILGCKDAHKRLVLQVYFDLNTLEFSAILE